MIDDYLFFMGGGVGISFRCVHNYVNEMRVFLEISEVHPTRLSSSCDNNCTYVKHVSFKNINFGGYKMMENR